MKASRALVRASSTRPRDVVKRVRASLSSEEAARSRVTAEVTRAREEVTRVRGEVTRENDARTRLDDARTRVRDARTRVFDARTRARDALSRVRAAIARVDAERTSLGAARREDDGATTSSRSTWSRARAAPRACSWLVLCTGAIVETMGSRSILLLLAVAALACDGRTSGETDGGQGSDGGSNDGSGSGSGSGSGGDASVVDDANTPITCVHDPVVGGSSGGVEHDFQLVETCSDGNAYSVNCWCPAAVCFCTKNGANDGSYGPGYDGGVPYSGCADAGWPSNTAWPTCGYPQ
jgi:hypothetical protein